MSGGDERRIFKAWVHDETANDLGPNVGKKYTFNSSELRMINVEMQLLPPVGGAALDVVRRCAPRAMAQAARQNWQGIAKRVQTQRADPPEQLWEIPAGNERLVLQRCC